MDAILKHWVGEKFWPWPNDHIRETRDRGPSIRVSPLTVPDLTPPYPVIFSHPKGTFTCSSFEDLWTDCVGEGHIPQDIPLSDVTEGGLPKLLFITVLEKVYKNDKKEYGRLVEKYNIQFSPAATHYSYITGIQVVIGDDGKGLDLVEELAKQGRDVEPVRVIKEGGPVDIGPNPWKREGE